MDEVNQSAPSSACSACVKHKRKCDKAVPRCGTCLRVGRQCIYERPSANNDQSQQHVRPNAQPTVLPAISVPVGAQSSSQTLDGYRYEALRRPTIDTMLSLELPRLLGDKAQIEDMANRYFATTYIRLPFLSKAGFFKQLPRSLSRADFILLCSSMHLITQSPQLPRQKETMQTSLYVAVKTHVARLEAANYVTLNVIQARVLVTAYEMGHAIYPAASASIAACARLAHSLGLSRKDFQSREHQSDSDVRAAAEEEKRTWWAILNLDRFIAFCTGEKILATEDPSSQDSLPVDDDKWSSHTFPEAHSHNLLTPADVTVGPFARECQILHLIGRLIRHLFEPSSDKQFHKDEAVQLERTLNAFMPLLMVEEEKYGFYCAALGMCSSALFTLYDSTLTSHPISDSERQHVLSALESTSTRIAAFSMHLFGPNAIEKRKNPDYFSPFIPYSIYQAAIVQYRLWKGSGVQTYKDHLDFFLGLLDGFGKRWQVGDLYADALRGLGGGWPSTALFVQDALRTTGTS